ncbi:hypothetical protein I6A84_22735 [Frankia sp. CNm7]|uniref:Uncharacterized protein n=1 Tax=Frankia nepalensis TaxID=1836974 RepID=A0A937UQ35_9ACTN|nr:hypothetical protein [Frankia nepalensis]MBL7495718.1 hypothetical protein [Frankia nepalensis]MBL7508992.1 hypothetical protein [Frankia nepalensis]MBL7520825.1 hypothetical protein [Frankia nepalensis]MBL7629792.1 hypothetical protein [Frankia nepalensis]
MGIDSDLREIWSVPVEQIAGWVARRWPDGASPQWWLAVFESLEVRVMPFRGATSNRRADDFKVAAEVIDLAVRIEGVRAAVGAYWMLRIASIARRFDPPIFDLPEILLPDGAAKWALGKFPITREQAIAESEIRKVRYDNTDESFYAPIGGEVNLPSEVEFSALQDVELIMWALSWISSYVEDEEVDREIHAWLELRYWR